MNTFEFIRCTKNDVQPITSFYNPIWYWCSKNSLFPLKPLFLASVTIARKYLVRTLYILSKYSEKASPSPRKKKDGRTPDRISSIYLVRESKLLCITYQVDSDNILNLFRLLLGCSLDVRFFRFGTSTIDNIVQVRCWFGQLEKEKRNTLFLLWLIFLNWKEIKSCQKFSLIMWWKQKS